MRNLLSATTVRLLADQAWVLAYLVQIAETLKRLQWLYGFVAQSQLLVQISYELCSLIVVHVEAVGSANLRRQGHVFFELERHESR